MLDQVSQALPTSLHGQPPYLTVRQASRVLCVSSWVLYQAIRLGQLPVSAGADELSSTERILPPMSRANATVAWFSKCPNQGPSNATPAHDELGRVRSVPW
jgi:hypothetical protein